MTYEAARHWVDHQPFLPARLRCEGARQPREELFAWRDHRIHLDRQVDDHAPVKLLALHGAGGNGRLLASVGIAARGRAETVAPDLPGYGHTQLSGDGVYRYEDWIACVEALVEHETARDGRPVVLLGASIGGMLAYDVASRRPEVAGVIATCLLEPRDPSVRRAVVRHPALALGIPLLLRAPRRLQRLRVPVRLIANMRAIANDPELARACLADPVGGGNRVPLAFLTSWLGSARAVEPERFTAPVLLVHPGEDRWTPAELSRRFLARVAGQAEYVELPGCGHFPVEEPGITRMGEAVLAFLHDVVEETAPG